MNLNSLKNITPKQSVYPAILIIFAGIIGLFFVLAVRFISGNIDAIFVINEKDSDNANAVIDLEKYSAAAKRLGIPPLPLEGNQTNEAPVLTPTDAFSSVPNVSGIASSTKSENQKR